jgi:diguanylate cyclase (GGDEF)-like protein
MTQEVRVTMEDIARAQAARRWNLTFPEPMEQRFEADIGQRHAKLLRIVTMRTLVIYNTFLIGDYLLVPDMLGLALVIQLAIVSPWMIIAALLMRHARGAVKRNLLLISVPAAMVAGIIAVFWLSRDPLLSHYQYFVLVALMYGISGLRPSIAYALGLSLVVIIAHGVACFAHPMMPPAAAVTASFSVLVAAGLTLMANFYIERDMRRFYLIRQKDNLAARDLQRTADDLQRISHVDALTGLANRRGVDSRAAALFAGAGATRRPFAVLMVDVDHFKGFNDQYGHPEGDRCLALAGAAIREAVRDGVDIIGRYGGEEFMAILPETDLTGGIKVAERMRKKVEALAVRHDRAMAGVVTVSIGVGVGMLGEGDSLKQAVVAADAALYEAKAAGRNCVRPPPGHPIAANSDIRAA